MEEERERNDEEEDGKSGSRLRIDRCNWLICDDLRERRSIMQVRNVRWLAMNRFDRI